MIGDYQSAVRDPLLASLTLLALVTGAFLAWGVHISKARAGQPGPRDIGDSLFGGGWGRWLLVVTLVFLAANQLLVRGVAVGTWDADGQFFPYYVLVADHARAARFVQWDPWSGGGLPLLGDPQVGSFSPVNVLLGLITGGTSSGFRFYWLLLWWLGGAGMLMLGRHLGAPSWGAAVVALAFLFCGVYTGNAEHTSWVVAFSFLPITIWRFDAALRTRRLWPAVEAGAVWGLAALAGYPGIIMLTGCLAAVWALGRLITTRSTVPPPLEGASTPELTRPPLLTGVFALQALALVLLVGLIVMSPTYVAFFAEGAGVTARVGALPRAVTLGNSLEPGALATFASPYLPALKTFRQITPGVASAGVPWPATDPSMVSIYLGSIVPMLALFALVQRPRVAWRWWLAGVGVLSLACALGETLPLRGWLYDWFYPTRFFRHSAMFRLFFVFAICVLALEATRDFASELRLARASGRSYLLLVTIILAAAAGFAFLPFATREWTLGMPENAVLLGKVHFGWVWLGVAVVALLAWWLPGHASVWCVPILLVAMAAGDALLTSVLSIPTTVRIGGAAARWRELDRQHRSTLDLTGNGLRRKASSCEPEPVGRCRSNDQLITKEPVFNAYTTDKNPFHLVMLEDPVLKGMALGAQRVWFAEHVADVQVTEGAFDAFRRRAAELGVAPLVVHSSQASPHRSGLDGTSDVGAGGVGAIERLPAAERMQVHVLRYQPGELVFDARTGAPGWLLVTDRWAGGWRAEIDGRPSQVYRGNFIFRALRMPAGAHRVRLVYRPAGFPWLTMASWGTLLGIGVGSLRRGRRIPATLRHRPG